MDPYEAYNTSTNLVRDISNHWQFAAFFVLCVTVAFIYWVQKMKADNKKLIEKQHELDTAETQNRKMARDAQINEMKTELQTDISDLSKKIDETHTIAKGVGGSLDKHVDDHKERDEKFWKDISSIEERLRRMEDNMIEYKEFKELQSSVNSIDKTLIQLHTLIAIERGTPIQYHGIENSINNM